MTKSSHNDPIDTLGAAYEQMYERAANNLHQAKDRTGPLLHELVDEARNKAVELEELSEEDAVKLADWLKRDLDDAVSYLSETGHELNDWLGFETTLLESAVLDLLLKAADNTTVELQAMQKNTRRPYTYHTGELAGPGTLVCEQCGEKLNFHKPGRIPPCPGCHGTLFHR